MEFKWEGKKDKSTFFFRTSNHESIVDSGASLHKMGRRSFSLDEQKTIRPTERNLFHPDITHAANVYVEDLDKFVNVKLMDDSLSVLSLGRSCEDMGQSSAGPR